MIGVEEAKLEQVLDLLKETAGDGRLLSTKSRLHAAPHGLPPLLPHPHGSLPSCCVFVLDLERLEKY
ncbi:MAG: hypothetical protein ACLS43_05355 [Evtepia gabavorous]